MEYTIREDATIDVADVIEGKKLVTSRWPNKQFYVLAQGINFFTLTRETRRLTSTKEFASNTKAVAFYTTNTSILLLSNMYLKIDKPAVPTKFFNNKEAAMEWLRERMKNEMQAL